METRLETACSLLQGGEVEQIGFIEGTERAPSLTMMGGELCINALLASASATNMREGVVTCAAGEARYVNQNGFTSVEVKLPYMSERLENDEVVIFDSIGYLVTENRPQEKTLKQTLRKMSTQYGLPAFGLIWRNIWRINPYVYVVETDSCVRETACGSGSVAAYICSDGGFAGVPCDIYQPTGQPITVQRTRDQKTFRITARVTLNS